MKEILEENRLIKGKRRIIFIDQQNIFLDIQKRLRRGSKLNLFDFYFNFIKYLTEKKPADVYFCFSKKRREVFYWQTELSNVGEKLWSIYSINCKNIEVPLKEKKDGVLECKVDHRIIRKVTQEICDPKKREKIKDLVIVSSDSDFIIELKCLAEEYRVEIIFVADWNPLLKRGLRKFIKIRYFKKIFQENPKLFKQFDFKKNT